MLFSSLSFSQRVCLLVSDRVGGDWPILALSLVGDSDCLDVDGRRLSLLFLGLGVTTVVSCFLLGKMESVSFAAFTATFGAVSLFLLRPTSALVSFLKFNNIIVLPLLLVGVASLVLLPTNDGDGDISLPFNDIEEFSFIWPINKNFTVLVSVGAFSLIVLVSIELSLLLFNTGVSLILADTGETTSRIFCDKGVDGSFTLLDAGVRITFICFSTGLSLILLDTGVDATSLILFATDVGVSLILLDGGVGVSLILLDTGAEISLHLFDTFDL
uniref:Uncharacterized protein n=1 Tax=Cacopsylla melanoneura TaxID=428564 RepID=A0A8D8UA95_9HEMI